MVSELVARGRLGSEMTNSKASGLEVVILTNISANDIDAQIDDMINKLRISSAQY